MKKLLLSLIVFGAAISVSAQYRNVKLPDKPEQTDYINYERENAGFWYAIEAEGGSSIMAQHTNMQYVNLSFVGGYRFSEYLRLGAGVGGRMYVTNASVRDTDNKYGVPIFANARGNLISAYDRDGVPFWSLNIGGITNEGVFVSPSVGYSFGGLRNNFLISLSYTITFFTDYTKTKQAYSYVGLKLGYEF